MTGRIEMEFAIIFHNLFFPVSDAADLFFLRKPGVEELFGLIRHYVCVEKTHPEEIPRMIVKMWKIEDAIVAAAFRRISFTIAEDDPAGEPCEPCEECHQKCFSGSIIGDVFEDADHRNIPMPIQITAPIVMKMIIACQITGIE
jgi:hypothetical protein